MVNNLGARYNRTVWVTEIDCPNAGGPVEHELAFMRNVTNVRPVAVASRALGLRGAGLATCQCTIGVPCLPLHHPLTCCSGSAAASGTSQSQHPRYMPQHRSMPPC